MKLHLIMQGKGGVGKTYITANFLQYLESVTNSVKAYDVDILNNTLTQFKALKASPVDLMDEDNPKRIKERKFDRFLEDMASSGVEHSVVDVGSSTVSVFIAYLEEANFFEMLGDLDLEVIVHVPISGGQSLVDNINSALGMYEFIGNRAKWVIWSNPYHGAVTKDGKALDDMKFFQKMAPDLLGLIDVPAVQSDTVKEDIENMVKNKLTYKEISKSKNFPIFSKSRLKKYSETFFQNIELVLEYGR